MYDILLMVGVAVFSILFMEVFFRLAQRRTRRIMAEALQEEKRMVELDCKCSPIFPINFAEVAPSGVPVIKYRES